MTAFVAVVAYAVMTPGALAVITLLASPDFARDAGLLDDYRGLFWRRPALSLAFAAALPALAGIPLTLGWAPWWRAASSGFITTCGSHGDGGARDRSH